MRVKGEAWPVHYIKVNGWIKVAPLVESEEGFYIDLTKFDVRSRVETDIKQPEPMLEDIAGPPVVVCPEHGEIVTLTFAFSSGTITIKGDNNWSFCPKCKVNLRLEKGIYHV